MAKSYHDIIVNPEAVIGPRSIDRRIMECRIPYLVALMVPWNPMPMFHHCSSYLELQEHAVETTGTHTKDLLK